MSFQQPMTLRWKGSTRLAIDAESLRPDLLRGRTAAEVARIGLPVGNMLVETGELFAIDGLEVGAELRFQGDLRGVARLGQGMRGGRIVVEGDAGPHLGAGLEEGEIEVRGSVGDWAGCVMRGGRIRIHEDAGDFLGGAYPGSRMGMREGSIVVHGNAGGDVGLSMRRGVIAMGGLNDETPGRAMIAWSLFLFGGTGIGPGAGMRRGTIVVFVDERDDSCILPTFVASGHEGPVVLELYFRELASWGFPVPRFARRGGLRRYNGDLAEGGQGEIYLGSRHDVS
jgi:formylmethanofuran dehydrogenase subunit C